MATTKEWMSKGQLRLKQLALLPFICLGFISGAHAQDDEESFLEEVVVTATKRTESLQDVGVSVTAFTAEAIERQVFADSRELLFQVANLDIANGTSNSTNANVFIRGVGSTGISFNLQSGVGFYFDEVVLSSPVVNVLQTYDLERVEVLRGPQNTLYGRNTTGGAVNYISRKPQVGGETSGYVNATAGRFSQFEVDGAYGGPIGEKAAYRAAFSTKHRDGWRTNSVDGSDIAFRGKLRRQNSVRIRTDGQR